MPPIFFVIKLMMAGLSKVAANRQRTNRQASAENSFALLYAALPFRIHANLFSFSPA